MSCATTVQPAGTCTACRDRQAHRSFPTHGSALHAATATTRRCRRRAPLPRRRVRLGRRRCPLRRPRWHPRRGRPRWRPRWQHLQWGLRWRLQRRRHPQSARSLLPIRPRRGRREHHRSPATRRSARRRAAAASARRRRPPPATRPRARPRRSARTARTGCGRSSPTIRAVGAATMTAQTSAALETAASTTTSRRRPSTFSDRERPSFNSML